MIAPGFEAVQEALEAYRAADPTFCAQFAAYHRGELVVDLTVGEGMGPDSLLPVYSSSKGATAVVVALMVQRGLLDLDALVSTYWPEFAQSGKAAVTVRQLLSHQAGLPGVTGGFSYADLLDHDVLAKRLAGQRPMWQPGTGHGYHALTIGTLADELVRRVSGRPVSEVLAQDVCGPRGIDVFLGTPASEDHRVAEVLMPTEEDLLAFMSSGSFSAAPLDGLGSVAVPAGGALVLLPRVNDEDFRRVGPPAAGGLASARGLARLYAALRHDVGGPRLLDDDTISQVSRSQVTGIEITSGVHARFGIIFQVPNPPRLEFGSWQAFGHDGAGGSLAVCDPYHDLAFGYTCQRVALPTSPEGRGVELSHVLRTCLPVP